MAASYAERQVGHRYTVCLFEDAAKSDPKDHLAEFFLALQLALGTVWFKISCSSSYLIEIYIYQLMIAIYCEFL